MFVVVLLFSVLCILAAMLASKKQEKLEGSRENHTLLSFFMGGRSLGGFVLAMTLVSTFTSSSSFLGGPGTAYEKGLAWAFLSMIQVPTAFIVLGVLGKKFAVISRKINAVTVNDFLRARYRNPALVIFCSLALILFFVAQMMAQFRGGAILFQAITGLNYQVCLVLFGILVISYTAFGGFTAVAVTDAIQGLLMVIGGIIILVVVVVNAGGPETMVDTLNQVNPGWDTVWGAGDSMPLAYMLSFWVLVGVGVLGLPQTAVRAMSFQNTKAMHNAMIYGTIVVGFLMLAVHIAGAFSPAVITMEEVTRLLGAEAGADTIISAVVLKYCSPLVAGLFFAAPLAAIMSTVDSLLLLAAAALVKDLYVNYLVKDRTVIPTEGFQKRLGNLSMTVTVFLGIVVIACGLTNPESIVTLNLYAMGGLECAFFFPVVGGLYWKKAKASGALPAAVLGVLTFIAASEWNWKFFGLEPVVPAMLITGFVFWAGSLLGKKEEPERLELFFPE